MTTTTIKRAVGLGLALTFLTPQAHAVAPTTQGPPAAANPYGQVYVALQPEIPHFEFSVAYKGGLSNPYFYTHGFDFGGKYFFSQGRYFVGLDWTLYNAGLNSFSQEVKAILSDQGLQSVLSEPRNHAVLSVGVVPLSGLLNLFSWKVLPFDVQLSTGVGRFAYQGEPTRTTVNLNLDYVTMVYGSFGVGTGIAFLDENSSALGWIPSIEAVLKFVGRF